MKKKGLIISTIVMVVVLIASLTTATYAWFSSSATVSVSNMSLTTTAAAGLEISVNNNDTTYSGALSMSEATYTGYLVSDTADWGSELSFSSPSASPHATTHLTWAAVDGTPTEANYNNGTYFTRTGAAEPYTYSRANEGADFSAAATYYVATADATNALANMYRPTGYDDSQNPTGYEHAINLTNYFYLPIRIRPTMQVRQIFYRVKITPNMGTAKSDFYPGMAAASRLEITGADTKSATPFNAAHVSGTAIVDGTSTKYNSTDTYSWDGFLVNGIGAGDAGADVVYDAYTEYAFNLQLWIEGTDAECINKTAGSGFTVEVVFGYVGTTGAYVTLSSGIISGYTFNNAAGTEVTVGTYQA